MRNWTIRIEVPAEGKCGELVWASCYNSLENKKSKGKLRPMILIHREGGTWSTAGLTTNPAFSDGTPREKIIDPSASGLRGVGYIWGSKVTRVSAIDIVNHIGWASSELIDQILGFMELSLPDIQALKRAAWVRDSARA